MNALNLYLINLRGFIMSLQIWLPLNGTLINQGVSDLNFKINKDLTLESTGKMGSCYSGNGTSSYLISNEKINLGIKQSMFCWIKVNSFNASSSLTGVCGQHRYQNRAGMGITLKYLSNTSGYLSVNTGTGDARTYNTYTGNTVLNAGNWYHIGYTYDGTTIKLYVNGKLDGSYTLTGMAIGPEYFQAFTWSLGGSGRSIFSGYFLNGSLNDIRVYDHVLSTKEIKHLAQGLIAHYPISGPSGGAPTVLSGKYNFEKSTNTGSVVPNGGPGGVDSITQTNTSTSYKEICSWGGNTVNAGEVWTASFYARSNNANNLQVYFYNNTSGLVQVASGKSSTGSTTTSTDGGISIALTNEWKKYWITWTFTSSGTAAAKTLLFRLLVNNNHAEISGVKLEKGAYSTSWAPKHYKKEYDRSGFRNHGTIIGNLSLETSVSNNFTAGVFSGSQAIACGRGAMSPDVITVNLWAYMDNWGALSNMRLISCTEGGGWNFENVGHFICYANGAYQRASGNFASISSGWHMITGTWDGYQAKIYLDGVLQASSTALPTKANITYNGSNGIFIGSEAGGNTSSPAGPYFTGKISDVRIYGTALSESEIKQLYQTPIAIDKDQNIYANTIQEGRFI
jgi:hypothetical protein